MAGVKLEDLGRAIKIGDVIIPASNIHVKDVPGFIELGPGEVRWEGIYFEIHFENGDLWEVSKGSTLEEFDDPTITAIVTEGYGLLDDMPENREISEVSWRSWNEFIDSYRVMFQVK